MSLSVRALNRATLARPLLIEPERVGVPEAVRRIVAAQAQEAASPYLALWNRLAGLDAAELAAAFAGHIVVKARSRRPCCASPCAPCTPRTTRSSAT